MTFSSFSSAKSAEGVTKLQNSVGETSTLFSASFTTAAHSLSYQNAFGVQAVISGSGASPAGTVHVSGSLDGTNFFGIGSLTSFSANGTTFTNFDNIAVQFIKVAVLRTTSSADTRVSIFASCR